MKYIFFLVVISGLFFACDGDKNKVEISDANYLVDKWQVDNQVIHFYDDTSAMVMSTLKDESVDTMLMYYSFQTDSSPVQLDMKIYEGKLKGMNLFGIIDMVDKDTFLMTSKMGFEHQAYKYRPKSFDSTKVVTYVRTK